MKKICRVIILCSVMVFCMFPLVSQNFTHTVEKSETLYSLSRKYGVTVQDIQKANGMGTSNAISIGQKLIIPNQDTRPSQSSNTQYGEYKVVAGDTLYSISRKSNISVDELRSINNLSASSVLKIGQILKVPQSAPVVTQGQNDVPPVQITTDDPREVSNRKGNINLVWPVKASEVEYLTGKISGVALTGQESEDVKAIRSGTVMFSGVYRGFGQVVFVQDTTEHIYVYTGLGTLSVNKGDYVQYGQVIGNIGNDTLSAKSRMNFMVYKQGKPIDPATAPRG